MAAWQGWYCVVIMMLMFGALLKNIAGPDVLMLGSLAMMLAADTVPIPEGLKGFSNKGLLTVACLFVVAAGISNTGALDYYMGKLLGHPKNAASAQIRLMVPVAFVSAFLNNTPVVAIMIPILQKWSRRVNIPNSQLMIPLSFASILGGTCTLIGTSTNLVVEGMMRERYPDVRPMGLFALSIYGVPVALSGMAYILIASPFLLPGGAGRADAAELQKKNDDSMLEDSLAVGAVVAPKSPVIDQPVATLRGLNGLYLVSVQRGDMLLRAVTPEFMLEEGDILHFTGLVESIGEVCVEHGLLPLTHEVEESLQKQKAAGAVSLSLEPAHADGARELGRGRSLVGRGHGWLGENFDFLLLLLAISIFSRIGPEHCSVFGKHVFSVRCSEFMFGSEHCLNTLSEQVFTDQKKGVAPSAPPSKNLCL